MKTRAGSPILDVDGFMHKLADYIRTHPQLASRAYANAAVRLRGESMRSPERGLEYQAYALKLDQLSAEADVPEIDPDSGEPVEPYAEYGPHIQTEFDAMVEDLAASKIAPDGSPREELESIAAFQELQLERERRIAPPVQITPASAKPGVTVFSSQALVQYGGIAGSGSFATEDVGAFGDRAAQAEAEVVRWLGREQETMVCTVSVYRVLAGMGATFPAGTNPNGDTYTYRPYFRCVWGGAQGAPNEVLGDIGRGTRFTVATNYLYVNVGMGETASTRVPGSMMLGATMGFFGAPGQSHVYYTMYADSIVAAGTLRITIPRFANTIESLMAVTPGDWTLTVRSAAAGALSNALSGSNLQQRGQAYALPDEAYEVLVTNSGGSTASAQIVFGISL